MGAERGTHATGVTTGATGVGGLAGQLTAGARRTSQVTYSAMGSPLATSGRVLQADSTRKAAQRQRFPRSAKSTADDACGKPHRNQGPMAKSGPISCRTAQKSHGNRQREQGTEVCSERGLRLAKLHPEHTSVPCSPDQRHLNAGHPLSVCESFPARLPHGGLQRPDKPSMRSGCPPQDP